LTDVLLIPPGIAGVVVLISRVWDAVTDPFMGIISDNTRFKLGRRRPYILAGGILIIFTIPMLFLPVSFAEGSTLAKTIYITFAYINFSTVETIIMVPYSSFSSEISNDYSERNAINSLRVAVAQIATLVCATLPLLLRDILMRFFEENTSYFIMGCVFGLIFGALLILTAIFTKERVPFNEEKSAFSFKTFVRPLKVKVFRQLVIMYLFVFLSFDIILTLFQHFMQYVAHRENQTSFVIGVLIIAQISFIPVVYKLTKTHSKPLIFKAFIPIWVLGASLLGFYNESWPGFLIYVFAAITGIGVSGCVIMPWLIFPDVADVGEINDGYRTSGSYSGLMTFARKLSSALGIAIVGFVLQFSGFDATLSTYGQPQSAITAFRAIVIVSTVLFLGISFVYASKSKLTEDKSVVIKDCLTYIRGGEPLPDIMQKRLDDIKEELIGVDKK